MDRDFMSECFNKLHEDIEAEVSGNIPEYAELAERQCRQSESLCRMLGRQNSKEWDAVAEYVDIIRELDSLLFREIYLLGAADRERMLR